MATLLDVPKGVSANMYRDVITAASIAYTTKRSVPNIDEIKKYLPEHVRDKTISRVLAADEFKELMKGRGFNFDNGTLSPEQFFAVGIITNASDRRPLNSKLKSAGITYAQYRAWLKQPHFRDYIAKVGEDLLGEHVADVHTRVVERATSGDIQAIKLYYELTGRHDPNRQQMVDLQSIIGLLLEVITRYVSDTATLAKINRDIEVIMSGKRPVGDFDVSAIANSNSAVNNTVVKGELSA